MTFRVLVATWNLREFEGSEIVAWEVAEYFAARGHKVTLLTTRHGRPMSELVGDFTVTTNATAIDLADYDLVWSQHHMVLQIPSGLEECVRRGQLPKIVAVSLSPYIAAEHVDGIIARAVGAEVWANSQETAALVSAVSRHVIPAKSIHVFHNAAPESFWDTPHSAPGTELHRLLIVSNHVPHEVLDAAEALRTRGLDVRVVGAFHERLRVDQALIDGADAVLTIGKTVVDALVCGRPVYVYDHFGGDGWLNPVNVEANRFHNFSGRPESRRLTGAQIADEIVSGYGAARAFAQGNSVPINGLRLSEHLDELLARVPRHHRRWRAFVLGLHFVSRNFRAHVATVRRLNPAQF